MKRFDCPSCGKSLGFRLLRHVPQRSGHIAFSCPYCGAVLTYNETRLGSFFGRTALRRLFTIFGGYALLSALSFILGKAATLALIGVLVGILLAVHFLSPRPAYRIVENESSDDSNQNRGGADV